MMRLLFLRGDVDSRTQKVDNLDSLTDMWSHLAANLCSENDFCKILYQGGSRSVDYSYNINEVWTKKFKSWSTKYRPDVVFARGGFECYVPVLRRFPDAISIYYGAGKRSLPKDGFKYDIILVDCQRDLQRAITKYPDSLSVLWTKPTVETLFYPTTHCKLHDLCYVANGQQEVIKRVKWVYKTISKGLFALHCGYPSGFRPPNNVNRVRVKRVNMNSMYNSCKIGIVPYTDYDSAPRAMAEMLACGLPIVVMDTVRHCYGGPKVITATKRTFWDAVDTTVKNLHVFGDDSVKYMDSTVNYLKRTIDEARQRKNGIVQRQV